MCGRSSVGRQAPAFTPTRRYSSSVPDVELSNNIHMEHADTFEAMAVRVGGLVKELADKGCIISSLSHAIDDSDPQGRVQFIVVSRSVAT
jgi:hypothetical protein